jgi:hypothetical protein
MAHLVVMRQGLSDPGRVGAIVPKSSHSLRISTATVRTNVAATAREWSEVMLVGLRSSAYALGLFLTDQYGSSALVDLD